AFLGFELQRNPVRLHALGVGHKNFKSAGEPRVLGHCSIGERRCLLLFHRGEPALISGLTTLPAAAPFIAARRRFTSLSIDFSESRSPAAQNEIATPPLPARAVRPIR